MSDQMDTKHRPPEIGMWFWWRGDSNTKLVRSFRVLGVQAGGEPIDMQWNIDAGSVMEESDLTGLVSWTRAEWDAAWNKAHCCLYRNPVKKTELLPNQELCRVCHGTRWEQDRDLEYHPCFLCNFTGVRNKAIPEESKTTRRSNLHPEMPKP